MHAAERAWRLARRGCVHEARRVGRGRVAWCRRGRIARAPGELVGSAGQDQVGCDDTEALEQHGLGAGIPQVLQHLRCAMGRRARRAVRARMRACLPPRPLRPPPCGHEGARGGGNRPHWRPWLTHQHLRIKVLGHVGQAPLEPREQGRVVQRPWRGGVRVPARARVGHSMMLHAAAPTRMPRPAVAQAPHRAVRAPARPAPRTPASPNAHHWAMGSECVMASQLRCTSKSVER